jgi:DNA-binding LytR/AlgR family response regulator
MPGLSGIEVAGRMTTASSVVFTTAFDRYAVEAFENGAIDYLLKPVTDARYQKT